MRITNMRGVDLNIFEFDYDLTWAALFMDANDRTYSRFGGRDAGSPDRYLTLAGFKAALRAALAAHRAVARTAAASASRPPDVVERYTAARQLTSNACIHCHQVNDFRREERKTAGTWKLVDAWVYPLPDNLGVTLDENNGQRVRAVAADSPAQRAGIRPGDLLQSLNDWPVASFADAQYALHRAPAQGSIPVAFQHGGQAQTGRLDLAPGWRRTDISWRASMWGMEPSPCLHGLDLTALERRELGLPEKGLAFRQGRFVYAAARTAGIQEGDVIVGVDGKRLDMTMNQFHAHVRIHYKVGDRITFNILRAGKRIEVPMTLPAKEHY